MYYLYHFTAWLNYYAAMIFLVILLIFLLFLILFGRRCRKQNMESYDKALDNQKQIILLLSEIRDSLKKNS